MMHVNVIVQKAQIALSNSEMFFCGGGVGGTSCLGHLAATNYAAMPSTVDSGQGRRCMKRVEAAAAVEKGAMNGVGPPMAFA